MLTNSILYLGGCGESWPPNTTPIQRAKFLNRYFAIDFCDLAKTLNSELIGEKEFRYFRLEKFSKKDILRALCSIKNGLPRYTYVWVGPSWRIVGVGRQIADYFSAKLVVDMFDHERLPAGVAWHKGRYLKALIYELAAIRLRYLLRSSDLFIHAIGNNISRYHLPNSVSIVTCLNGVSPKLFPDGIQSMPLYTNFSLCYVGECSDERTPILSKIIDAAKESELKFDFHLIGFCDPAYLARLKFLGGQEINIIFHGFLPWIDAMHIVAKCHICLYLFPDREDLSCVYPLKIAEYFYLGKPVLASKLPGAKLMLGDSLTECLISHDDPNAWIAAINRMLFDYEYRLLQSERAKERAKFLDWDCLHAPLKAILIGDSANSAFSSKDM